MLQTPVSCPKGFRFATTAAGFKTPGRPDLALVVSESLATAAAMFTTNRFLAAPVLVGQELLAKKRLFRAILINTGQANACTGSEGLDNCRSTLQLVAEHAGIKAEEILPASTGVIGNQLKMDLWKQAVPRLVSDLGQSSPDDFARAIMTTDSFHKIASTTIKLDGGTVTLCGIAKGAGMICPNMATMLSVLLCDAQVEAALWKKLLQQAVELTFNRATVDGDTSTNDTVYALANGAAELQATEKDSATLLAGMVQVLGQLAYMLVQDGEGATKVMHIRVNGAATEHDAELAARTIGHSPLVKTAMFGQDANWGRIIAALGRCGANYNPDEVVLTVCGVELFRAGQPTSTEDSPVLVQALKERDILIELAMGSGSGSYELLASDLTHDYVALNADYRS